jgi:triosephosphate isomerase
MAEQAARGLIAGNWKMHGVHAYLEEARALAGALSSEPARARVAVCPPATLIHRLAQAVEGSAVEVGAQDCRREPNGAYTGDLSAEMLHDAGARLVILGHSERRTAYTEDDALIAGKVEAALRAGLEPIVCVGEMLEQRKAGQALDVVRAQTEEVASREPGGPRLRRGVRARLGHRLGPDADAGRDRGGACRHPHDPQARFGERGARAPVLYGGSVKPSNATEILALPTVDGALVGGASLKASDFLPIVRAYGG